MTVALPGIFPVTALTGLTAHAALCVCFALEEIAGISPGIKWINDIFLYNTQLFKDLVAGYRWGKSVF